MVHETNRRQWSGVGKRPRVVVVGECHLYGWWPVAVAGGIRELGVCSCRVRTCFVYVIKLLCYGVQIYECIPGIYVIARVI